MSAPLPLGVLIPTLNARAEVEQFLPRLQPVLDLAEEVVVVDSFSEDGTLAWLQTHLRHPNARFLSHPRGLYASWNFGLGQLQSRYAYIATIGDLITAPGLRRLVQLAQDRQADVVLSPPEFFDTAGKRVTEESNWPIHRLLAQCQPAGPVRLEPWQVFLLATVDVPRGILGSSASNVYRTQLLREHPFPVEFGHAGDSAWAIANAFRASILLTPEVVSRFVIHPNETAGMSKEKYRQLMNRLFDLAEKTAGDALAAAARNGSNGGWLPLICSVPGHMRRLYDCQDRYDAARRAIRPWPWIFNSQAWSTRAARNAQRTSVRQMAAQLPTHPGRPRQPEGVDDSFLALISNCIDEVC